MSAGPDDSELVPIKPWQQWLIDAAVAADAPGVVVYSTEVLPQWPVHKIKAVRVVPGQEWVKCTCGAVLPIERDGGDFGEAVGKTFRQHLEHPQEVPDP
jgi:hypothetical protein